MLIKSFPAGPWQTNCYVVSTGVGNECLIIDPGMGAATGVREIIAENHLKPIAVLVTHGHIDHMWSVFPVATGYDIPAVVHSKDRFLLSDPGLAVTKETREALPAMLGEGEFFAEPEEVLEVHDRLSLSLAGIDITVLHAPGHTQGSVLYNMHLAPEDSFEQTVFTGDVLFAGAIGRTDLPGGSASDMATSLRDVVLQLPDNSLVFPGHGPSSNMSVERETNEYLIRVAQGMSPV